MINKFILIFIVFFLQSCFNKKDSILDTSPANKQELIIYQKDTVALVSAKIVKTITQDKNNKTDTFFIILRVYE